MSRRVGALLAVALVLAAIVVMSRRGGGPTVARRAPTPSPSQPSEEERPWRSAPATPVLPVAREVAEVGEAIDVVEVAQTDGVAFAQEYADALCACTEASCLDEVRTRYARRTGEAQPSNDVRSLHEAFVRGQACVRAIRAASAS